MTFACGFLVGFAVALVVAVLVFKRTLQAVDKHLLRIEARLEQMVGYENLTSADFLAGRHGGRG